MKNADQTDEKVLIKGLILTSFYVIFSTFLFAQVPDSLSYKCDSLLKINANITRLDSTSTRLNNKIDSTQSRLDNLLNPDLNTLTSRFKRRRPEAPDSLRTLHEYDSLKSNLTHKIDSLKGLNLSTDKYTHKLDSLKQLGPDRYVQIAQQRKQQLESRITQPVTDATQKINQPLDQLDGKIKQPIDNIESKVNDKLNLMRKEGGDGANLPGNLSVDTPSMPNADINSAISRKTDMKIPGTDVNVSSPLGDVSSPLNKIDNHLGDQTGNLNDLKGKATDVKSVPQQQLDKVKSIDEIQTAKEKVGDINQTTDKIQAYEGDVKNIAQGNVGEVKQIPDAIENKAKSLDEIKALETQTGELNKAKAVVDKGKDPEALKEMAKQEVMKKATDHFAGKEQVLQSAMEKVGKLKSKYSEVTSLADLPKRPPNPMKGKPLIERIVPGITTQIQKSSYFLLDLNPVISYRFTGHINAGVGWNERLSFVKWNKLNRPERIYGPRVFGSYSLKKGYGFKLEIEKMNTVIPPFALSPDAGTRQWIWSVFVGMKKDYKLVGKVRGNVQILYNIFDDHDNSPYADRLNVRMGFEFPMKKKKG